MSVTISVVIPAYNEELTLPRLLSDIATAKSSYRRGPEAVEVIVADNGSTDKTHTIAATSGARVVNVALRRIGAVRNGGAAASVGGLLAFVDADTRIHPETFNAIDDLFANGSYVVGASGILPERRSLGIDATWLMLAVTTALLGYGVPRTRYQSAPTGVVCCRRADWATVGGYSERLLFAEDARFLFDLKKLGRRRGQRVGWLRDVPATFSARKFDEHGDWHYVFLPLRFVLGLLWFPGLRAWAERYWYGDQRVGGSRGGG
jgi:glycosyltransferase involved in cell wall biosynthesis